MALWIAIVIMPNLISEFLKTEICTDILGLQGINQNDSVDAIYSC